MINIFLGLAVITLAVYLKLKYRPNGATAAKLFAICVFAGVVMLLTVGRLSTFSGALFYLADIVICGSILMLYRFEAVRQLAARKKRRARAKAAMAQAQSMIMRRRPLSALAAFGEEFAEVA